MSESIKQRTQALAVSHDGIELKKLLDASLTDLTAIRTTSNAGVVDMTEVYDELTKAVADIAALRAAIVGVTAKLDSDAGVTDTDYASLHDPAAQTSATPATQTSSAAAALTLIS